MDYVDVKQLQADADRVLGGVVDAVELLERGCSLYCRWHDRGDPEMTPSGMAYEMYSFVRLALHKIRGGGPVD